MVKGFDPMDYVESCEACGAIGVQLHSVLLGDGDVILLCGVCFDIYHSEGETAIMESEE